ncbi:MAG TPA: UDP-3-O-[3-hydroxymyristoyl] N-acetylglucosamine deacetylase [Firmicutes bacterium]|nr:UDP-3-O-[3-hydroxymyristoyl] N-acetylglucosamine deacetylase [Bacillota bacterium]
MTEQQTLGAPVEYAGKALHSGVPVFMRLLPAPADTGIIFRRIDLPGKPEIPATVEHIVSTNRNTTLGNGGAQVMTVEHLMAALRGMGIDNAVVELDAGEIPLGDGSAQIFVELVCKAGIIKQGVPRRYLRLKNPVWVSRNGSHMIAVPADELKITYTFVTDHPVVGTQFGEYSITADVFGRELAGARTLVFGKDIEFLRSQGLGRGGDLDCVVIVDDDGYRNSLRYRDEIVRHKILDVVGDMGLLGFLHAHIIAVRSGHELNKGLMQEILRQRVSEDGSADR